jgi:hypothetical protein
MTSEGAWRRFGAALANLKSAIHNSALDEDAGFLVEELALLDAVKAYADERVRKALAITVTACPVTPAEGLPAKYAPDGIAYRLNGRNDREPPSLIPRAEAVALLDEGCKHSRVNTAGWCEDCHQPMAGAQSIYAPDRTVYIVKGGTAVGASNEESEG